MSFDPEILPEDLRMQRGLPRSSHRYIRRPSLVRQYVNLLISRGTPVTVERVRELLVWVDRDYSLKIDQIGKDLVYHYRDGRVDRYTSNGQPVLIDGTKFSTVRKAGQSLGVSPQTVLNRINSDDPKWADWRRA